MSDIYNHRPQLNIELWGSSALELSGKMRRPGLHACLPDQHLFLSQDPPLIADSHHIGTSRHPQDLRIPESCSACSACSPDRHVLHSWSLMVGKKTSWNGWFSISRPAELRSTELPRIRITARIPGAADVPQELRQLSVQVFRRVGPSTAGGEQGFEGLALGLRMPHGCTCPVSRHQGGEKHGKPCSFPGHRGVGGSCFSSPMVAFAMNFLFKQLSGLFVWS